MHNKKTVDHENERKDIGAQNPQWQIKIRWLIKTLKDITQLFFPALIIAYTFILALIISKILRFEMFDLEHLGQGHRVQRSQ